MKTNVLSAKIATYFAMVIMLLNTGLKAQTYSTKANGAWSNASTWVGGAIPNASNIPATAVINIKHSLTYSGNDIVNNGTINIYNAAGISPRIEVANNVNITNKLSGKINITGGELQQYRFTGGGQSGTNQGGNFTNDGGYVQINSSYVEIAQNWTNQKTGIVVFKNSSVVIGKDYEAKDVAIDTIIFTSVSVGWQGSGDFREGGLGVYFQSFRAEIASADGSFKIDDKVIANGGIDYVSLKNDFTGITGPGGIEINKGIVTTGISLQAYCVSQSSNYKPNGMCSGPQTADCSLNYFPALLNGATAPARMNFSVTPLLTAGIDKQVGAKYKYRGVAPGVDVLLSIDSIIGGATINSVDDNTGAYGGFPEAFQPIITSGPAVGTSYAVFTFNFLVTGTSVPLKLDTFGLTAIDIDGTSTLQEFDQISAGPGATASYIATNPAINLTQVSQGTFMGINADRNTVNNVDTVSLLNMFTVKNTNISTFTAKLGMVTTKAQKTQRLFSLYTKGFNYPNFLVMPVKLVSFDAILNKGKVDLNWTTANQQNVSHFIVERSTDGINFSDAGMVFSVENSSQVVNYSLKNDISSLNSNMLYYRLCTVDMDGRTQYSDIRVIRIAKQADNSIAVLAYPNPVVSELFITIPSSWQNTKVTYELFNIKGQLSLRAENRNSSQTESINVNNLTPGVYIMKVSCDGKKTAQQKIVKF